MLLHLKNEKREIEHKVAEISRYLYERILMCCPREERRLLEQQMKSMIDYQLAVGARISYIEYNACLAV